MKVTSPDDHDVTRGNLCIKGRFGYDYVKSPWCARDRRARLAEELEPALAREESVRRRAVFVGYGASGTLCAGALPPAEGGVLARAARRGERRVQDRRLAPDVDSGRVPGAIETVRGDSRGRRLPGETSSSTSGPTSPAIRSHSRPPLCRCGRSSPGVRRATAGRSSPPRRSCCCRSCRQRRPHIRRSRDPSGWRPDRVGEGHGRARDDRRPGAERPHARLCPGTVRWPELLAERQLAGVTHLVATVEGELRQMYAHRAARRRAAGRLRSRAPEERALGLIAALEPVGRGASMGALGRTYATEISISRSHPHPRRRRRHDHLWVGDGIVWDSEAVAEIRSRG